MTVTTEELYMLIGSYRVEVYMLNKEVERLTNELVKERQSAIDRSNATREHSGRLADFPKPLNFTTEPPPDVPQSEGTTEGF